MNVAALSPEEVVSRVRSLNGEGNRVLAKLLVHMGEMDARKLYEKHAYSSMFAFCRGLGMSEGSASRRIDSARAIRKFPCLLPRIESGELHLTALSIVSSILTPDNVDSVIAAVAGKTRREVEAFKVRYVPKPRVKDLIRKLPAPATTAQPEATNETLTTPPPVAVMQQTDLAVEPSQPEPPAAAPARIGPPMRPVVPLQEDA